MGLSKWKNRVLPRITQCIGVGLLWVSASYSNDAVALKKTVMLKVATKVASFKDEAYVTSLAFSPDGNELASEFNQQFAVRIWEWRSGVRLVKTLEKPPGSGSPNLWDVLAYSSDGRYLSFFHGRTTIPPAPGSFARVVNIDSWSVAHDFSEESLGVAKGGLVFDSGRNQFLVVVDRRGQRGTQPIEALRAYDATNWQLLWTLDISPLLPIGLEITPDGRNAAVGGSVILKPENAAQSRILIVDLNEKKIVRSIDPFPQECSMERMSWGTDSNRLAVASFRLLASCPMGGTSVAIFDGSTGNQVSEDHSSIDSHVRGLRFTPDGKYLIEAGLNQGVRIWDSAQAKLLQTLPGEVTAMAVTRDGGHLAVSNGPDVTIWELN